MSKPNKNLTRSLKNDRSNKELLRTEINNATDPNVRLELTKMLVEIENKEKKKRMLLISLLSAAVVVILMVLLYLGSRSTKEIPLSKTQTSTSQITKNSETTESTISELNLSEEQIKAWVMSILDLTPAPPTKYILTVRIDDTDNLAYVHVGVDQLDSAGSFRINAKGQLEFLPRGPMSNWVLMSDKYMDTSIAEEYYKEQAKVATNAENETNEVKKHLIGKTFTIKPLLYDGIEAEQAMTDNKAPQNLIHDGVQIITFTNRTSARIELAGNYRTDYDETYTLSSETINLKDYYIPYTFNNGSLSFDTWTTDVDGHTITWAMSPQ